MKTFINNNIFKLKKMFIKNYKNYLIDLNVINNNTLIKCVIKYLIMIIILIKL